MKKILFLTTAALFLTSFQAQAVTVKQYLSLKGGYSAMQHRTKERYNDSPETPTYKWNDNVASASVAFGLKAGYLRAEIEGNVNDATSKRRDFRTNDGIVDETVVSKIKTNSVFFNTYLEMPFDWRIKPYIGAGAGMAHVKAQFKSRSIDDADKLKFSGNHFAWQVGAGLSCEITPEWAIDLGYRFMDFGNILKKEHGFNEDGSFYSQKMRATAKAHNAYFGIRYMFSPYLGF